MATEQSRDWAGRTIPTGKIAYINGTGANVDMLDGAILVAIANGGVFGEDLADMFTLRCPAGVWILEFA